jgi:hypothetical protein
MRPRQYKFFRDCVSDNYWIVRFEFQCLQSKNKFVVLVLTIFSIGKPSEGHSLCSLEARDPAIVVFLNPSGLK